MNFIIGLFTGIAASMGLGGGFILIIYLTVFRLFMYFSIISIISKLVLHGTAIRIRTF